MIHKTFSVHSHVTILTTNISLYIRDSVTYFFEIILLMEVKNKPNNLNALLCNDFNTLTCNDFNNEDFTLISREFSTFFKLLLLEA